MQDDPFSSFLWHAVRHSSDLIITIARYNSSVVDSNFYLLAYISIPDIFLFP